MKNPLQAVRDYLKTDRSLLGGRNLYNKLPGKSRAVQNYMTRLTDTPKNLARLHYELAKSVGIQERELKILLQKPLEKPAPDTNVKKTDPPLKPITTSLDDELIAFDDKNANYQEAKKLFKALGLEAENMKGDTIYPLLSEARKKLLTKQVSELPAEVKASIKLRDQFPFLRSEDCPDVLLILVGKLINSYEAFKNNQPKLHEVLSQIDEAVLAEVVVKDYIENKMAWDELEHYNTHGTILGKHPMFEMIEKKEEIAALDTLKLADKIKNLENNINRNKNKGNDILVKEQEELLQYAKEVLSKR